MVILLLVKIFEIAQAMLVSSHVKSGATESDWTTLHLWQGLEFDDVFICNFFRDSKVSLLEVDQRQHREVTTTASGAAVWTLRSQ